MLGFFSLGPGSSDRSRVAIDGVKLHDKNCTNCLRFNNVDATLDHRTVTVKPQELRQANAVTTGGCAEACVGSSNDYADLQKPFH